MENISKAVDDVIAERMRQIKEKGYTLAFDRVNSDGGQLIKAAMCYAGIADMQNRGKTLEDAAWFFDRDWPWDLETYKPKADARRNLVISAAFLLAEIERLDAESEATDGWQR